MPKPLVVTIAHSLGRDEAKRRIASGLDQIRTQLAGHVATAEYAWDGDVLNFHVVAMRQAVDGRIEIGDDTVRVEVGLPLLLRVLADPILGRVRDEGARLLGKPKP